MTAQPILAVLLKGYPRLSETFIAQEILSLERAGFRIRIISMRQPTDTSVHPIHAEIRADVAYLPEYLHDDPLRVLRALLSARKLPGFRAALRVFFRDLRGDISRNRFRRFGQAAVMAAERSADDGHIHAHFIHTPASVARYASLMTGLPWSCSAHAKDIWTTGARELADKLADAQFTVTCTRVGLERLNALALPERPAQLVYHGLDLSRFRPMSAPLAERDGSDPLKPVRFLTVARAVEKKGLDTLIDALALLPPGLAWTWTHIGGGGLTKALQARAERHGIVAKCRFLGARSQADVIAAYTASDAFVLPCRIAADGDRDGLPNVLMEAASQGLALISTPVSGVTELVEDGVTGSIIPPDNAAALAGEMLRLAQAPHDRFRLGREASRKVFAQFDHVRTMTGLVALFPAGLRPASPPRRHVGLAAE
jgi:glycosyltransferase involved in cell wall biosynthesis